MAVRFLPIMCRFSKLESISDDDILRSYNSDRANDSGAGARLFLHLPLEKIAIGVAPLAQRQQVLLIGFSHFLQIR